MDAEMRGHLENAADEIIDDLVEFAKVGETVPPEYVLGMMEVALIGIVDDEFPDHEWENNEEEIVRKIRQMVFRREENVREALNQSNNENNYSANETKIFQS